MNSSPETEINCVSHLKKFDDAASKYHRNAVVQREVAQRLIASLKPWKEILPAGPVIELGCGTGYLSKQLARIFDDRNLIFTDDAPQMLEACKEYIRPPDNVKFKRLNAEDIPVQEPTYAMTISSFVAQWFRHPAHTLSQWLEVTKPGGLLLAAFPGSESFPEWKQHTQALGIPFTGNDLPDTEEIVVKLSSAQTQVDYYEDTISQKFESAADFFRHLKKIGAGQQLQGRPLTTKEMRMLVKHWNEQAGEEITVSWHVVFLAVKKNAV